MIRRVALWALAGVCALALFAGWLVSAPSRGSAFAPFPTHRDCAIAITDDADGSRPATVAPVYALLDSLGIRVTIVVRVFDRETGDPSGEGLSLDDPAWAAWVLGEAERGHEIALHLPSRIDDDRAAAPRAHERFVTVLGSLPRTGVPRDRNRDRASERDLVRYVRTYTTSSLNTLALNPSMPCEDARTPLAPLGFAAVGAPSGDRLVELLAARSVERLKAERGAAIVRTRFTEGLTRGDRRVLRADVREAIARCGADPAIEFIPAGDLLDRLRAIHVIEDALAPGPDGEAGGIGAERIGREGRDLRISVPRVLLPALHGISVDTGRLPRHLRARFDGGGERMGLLDWLARARVVVDIGSQTVFDGARTIGPRERWRLVLRSAAARVATGT